MEPQDYQTQPPQDYQTQPPQPIMAAPKKNKYLVIILVFLVTLCLGLMITIVIINTGVDSNYSDENIQSTDTVSVDDAKKQSFDSLTKNEAMDYLRKKASSSKNEILPNGFLPQELMLENYETDLVLLPSYDNPSEILQTLFDDNKTLISFTSFINDFEEDDFKFDTSSNGYWTVFSIDPSKCLGRAVCPKGVAFDKKYIDYYNQYAGDGMSEHYIVKFNDYSQEFVKTALPILVFTGVESGGLKFTNSVYSYVIEETDDKYILTLQSIGIQTNPQDYYAIVLGSIEEISTPTAINLYEVKFELDRQTGRVAYQTNESGGKTNIIKTFEVSEEDGEELKQMLIQRNGA